MSRFDELIMRQHRSSGMALVQRPELASGIRLDGRFEGPKTDTSSIWKGRPPTLPDGTPFPSLVIAMANSRTGPTPAPGLTATCQAEGAAGNGGRTVREFEVGFGLTAELMVGYYDHIVVRVVTPIPAGMSVFFVWSLEVFSNARLWKFVDYPIALVPINLPEGVDQITVESACTLTFLVPQFGTTFTKVVAAGEIVPVVWSAMTCSVPNKFLFRLKSL